MHRKNGTTNLKVRASTYSRAKSRASGTFDSSNLLQYRLLYITFGVKAEEVKRRGGEGKSKQNQKGKYTTEITQREAHIEKDPKRKTVHPLCSLKPKMKDIINYTFEDNKDELVIIVNEENEFQGLETRKVMRTSNLWHRSTSVFVFTKINEEYFIYVHKRSNIKDYCPSYYSIGFGGVVSEKETFIGNAVKELQEESGITKKPEQLFELGVLKCDTDCSRSFVMSYVNMQRASFSPSSNTFAAVTFVDPAFETTPQPNEVEFITKIPLNEFDSFLQREQLTVISNHKRTKNLAFLLTKINFQMIK
ncbi:nucleoside diphospahte hydrolase [Plasmodium ovale curtisi]|uniref:Nucleoside diphospahte hydrolase n=1 Tax=Plasmodium ovale curtisi TaxID=864141 RepID=A0A1A8VYT6_PLAOA|nr:nucleoside diphospahte hydrolase [Plasmodium ovale curtisi]